MPKLRFKGDDQKVQKKRVLQEESQQNAKQQETVWIKATDLVDLKGPLFIVIHQHSHSFTFWSREESSKVDCRISNSPSSPDRVNQVIVAFPFDSVRYFGLKTAYGKALKISSNQKQHLEATNEAIGQQEQWEFEKKESGEFFMKSRFLKKYLAVEFNETQLANRQSDSQLEGEIGFVFVNDRDDASVLDIFIQLTHQSKEDTIEKYKGLNDWSKNQQATQLSDKDLLRMGKRESVGLQEMLLEKRAKLKSDKYCK